ncbi:MAG: leucyl aminopeptidase [Desulfovibrionaceae bacterium]
METTLRQAAPEQWSADACIIFCFAGEDGLPGHAEGVATAMPWLPLAPARADFKAQSGKTEVVYNPDTDAAIPRVVLAGLGKRDACTVETLRNAVASALRACRARNVARAALPVAALAAVAPALTDAPAGMSGAELTAFALEEAAIAAALGLYRFTAFKTKKDEDADNGADALPETLHLFTREAPDDGLKAALASARAIAAGVALTRDLVNAPPNTATPEHLANAARDLAACHGFSATILGPDDLSGMGMGAFEAVFKGSRESARLIVLEHAPAGCEKDKPLILVGKGVTFDTGGISLKPAAHMQDMKGDMAGAAAVLGAMDAIGGLGVQRRVIGIAPCTENMPDGGATRPGDIVTTLAGKTVEIINTDAEGRLILCDALAYALRFEPAAIVDVATLTGACVVALGAKVAAVFGNHQGLIDAVVETGGRVGDRFWPMPLWDFFFDTLKSDYADMKNVGAREGGAIHAAMFLKQFVPDEVPWAHLDIAGPAFADKGSALTVPGGTGMAVRTMVGLARGWRAP